MSFMVKIAFAVQLTVAGAFGLDGTNTSSTSEPAASSGPIGGPCYECADYFDFCISEGISPASCEKQLARCYKTCWRP